MEAIEFDVIPFEVGIVDALRASMPIAGAFLRISKENGRSWARDRLGTSTRVRLDA
jgi:hypothetical protein